MIPEYLLSTCMERMGIGMSACPGSCGDEVRLNPETGRWFITMGHPGFNSPLNNGRGYYSKVGAQNVIGRYRRAALVPSCQACGYAKDQHHFGPDGPGSGFVHQATQLFCPGNQTTFR